jgi:NAD(P)-dependent dehydrogenase (short-subunit alcohol dehydrogenase family)
VELVTARRTAIVTGANHGIGAATAVALAAALITANVITLR